jgi:hypothetical protein
MLQRPPHCLELSAQLVLERGRPSEPPRSLLPRPFRTLKHPILLTLLSLPLLNSHFFSFIIIFFFVHVSALLLLLLPLLAVGLPALAHHRATQVGLHVR